MTVLAHGLGGSADLPIPFTYALIGAAWALTFTFAVVALAWRKPRFDPDKPGRALPPWVTAAVDAPVTRWAVGIVGLLLAVWVGLAAFLGPQNADNPLPGVFYVLMWVGLVAVSLAARAGVAGALAGAHGAPIARRQVVTQLSGGAGLLACGVGPVRVRMAGAGQSRIRDRLPPFGFGCWSTWPSPSQEPCVCGARWCARADPFEVYGMVVSRLSALRRNRDGRIAIGNPFDHLPSLPVRPGIVAVLSVLLGSTAFDSFSARPQWRTLHRRDCGVRRDGDADQHGGPARLRRRGRGHVLAGREGDGRSRSRAAPRAAGADGAFAHSDRRGLRVRPLPDLPDRARTADRLSCCSVWTPT